MTTPTDLYIQVHFKDGIMQGSFDTHTTQEVKIATFKDVKISFSQFTTLKNELAEVISNYIGDTNEKIN